MRSRNVLALRCLLVLFPLFVFAELSMAQVVNTGLFTQNRLRECGTPTACIGGAPTIELQSGFGSEISAPLATYISRPALGAQGATSVSYFGPGFIPAHSGYAYTAGPQRWTQASLAYQRYELLGTGPVTFDATLTFSQSGETNPVFENPRGIVIGSIIKWEFTGDEFDPHLCNFFSDVNAGNAAASLIICIVLNGQELFPGGPMISFPGVHSVEVADFVTGSGPVTNGSSAVQLTVNGAAGDFIFIGSTTGGFAHLGGFVDYRDTLLIEIDDPGKVQATFAVETYAPAPGETVDIDIKPGSDPNCLNINGKGKIPVAIHGSDSFDVLNIDSLTLTFGGLDVASRGKKGPMCNPEYSNADALLDLVCHFQDSSEAWAPDSDEEASVDGRLIDGRPFTGTDSICLVP